MFLSCLIPWMVLMSGADELRVAAAAVMQRNAEQCRAMQRSEHGLHACLHFGAEVCRAFGVSACVAARLVGCCGARPSGVDGLALSAMLGRLGHVDVCLEYSNHSILPQCPLPAVTSATSQRPGTTDVRTSTCPTLPLL